MPVCYINEWKTGRWPAIIPSLKFMSKETTTADYQAIYNRYYNAICRQLTYMLGNQATAEDIAQETFLKLHNTPPKEYQNIGGWLSRVATNLAYNYLRSEKSRQNREKKTNEQACTLASSEEIALQHEERRIVHETLEALPDRDRICLIMKHSGFTYDEIAESIDVKKTSVGTIIARAQARFKKTYMKQKGSDA